VYCTHLPSVGSLPDCSGRGLDLLGHRAGHSSFNYYISKHC